jgi:hypothetical protein
MIDLCAHWELAKPSFPGLPPSLARLLADMETVPIRKAFSCPVEMFLHRLRHPSIPAI